MIDSTATIDSTAALADSARVLADSAAAGAAHVSKPGGLALIAAGIALGVLIAIASVVTQQLYRRRLAALGVEPPKSSGKNADGTDAPL